jgi:hypothetical protein
MKQLYLLLLISIVSTINAQPYSGNVKLTSSGGAIVRSVGYSGSSTIGLPFVGIGQHGGYSSKMGLYGIKYSDSSKVGVAKNNSSTDNPMLYPNPTTGEVTLLIDAEMGELTAIYLFSMDGRIIAKLPFILSRKRAQILINDQPNGTYFLRAEGEKATANYKVTFVR